MEIQFSSFAGGVLPPGEYLIGMGRGAAGDLAGNPSEQFTHSVSIAGAQSAPAPPAVPVPALAPMHPEANLFSRRLVTSEPDEREWVDLVA